MLTHLLAAFMMTATHFPMVNKHQLDSHWGQRLRNVVDHKTHFLVLEVFPGSLKLLSYIQLQRLERRT